MILLYFVEICLLVFIVLLTFINTIDRLILGLKYLEIIVTIIFSNNGKLLKIWFKMSTDGLENRNRPKSVKKCKIKLVFGFVCYLNTMFS